MTDRELMQQALEALEPYETLHSCIHQVVTALRERLAQPEQHEPWCDSVTKLLLSMPPQIPPCNCKSKQPEQKPFMVVAPECAERGCMGHDDRVDGPGVVVQPRREWVGLTDSELREAYIAVSGNEWCLGGMTNAEAFYEAIEQALREKNT